ncbi:hypothetical protein PSHT_03847 [Puccinia striiformis]|uniref:DUF659 domain-containing protein n=1 Tax=Puccinia striiformis TaxID=27350 RepID=A0A2S4WEE5_9BASI|nr:hypothetical protein PSHT_03847 [Puccinia striiformis]
MSSSSNSCEGEAWQISDLRRNHHFSFISDPCKDQIIIEHHPHHHQSHRWQYSQHYSLSLAKWSESFFLSIIIITSSISAIPSSTKPKHRRQVSTTTSFSKSPPTPLSLFDLTSSSGPFPEEGSFTALIPSTELLTAHTVRIPHRHKPSSPTSSISSIPAQNPKPSNNKQSRTVVDVADESEEEEDQGASDQDVETIASTENSKGVHQLTTSKSSARQTHANRGSASYAYFDPPQLADALDKHRRRMLAYPCKTCGTLIHRPTYETSPTNLSKHVASCSKRAQDAQGSIKLSALGITGTGDIDPREVPQLCAIWCAQGARPFAALGEDAHRNILHPVVVKTLPKRRTVSNDIARLYTAVQAEFIETLRKHEGAMYLGLDAWQSPNGFDILGTVLYRLVDEGPGGFHLEAMPLDFVKLHQSHTGVYLAQTVQLIVEKFGVKEKICGIVTDNASTRFKGETQWIRCFAHILNLIAQVILRPFGSHQKKRLTSTFLDDEQDSDLDEEDPEDPDDQIHMFTEGGSGDEDEDEDNNDGGNDQNNVVSNLINDDEIELEDDDLNEMSDEGEDINTLPNRAGSPSQR